VRVLRGLPETVTRMNERKLLQRILSGSKNIRFDDMIRLVEAFGFYLSRVRGSHHIFSHPDIPELVNLQNVSGQAKPYQIRQFLKLVEKYNLQLGDK
jgi:predicted RNA binding protein YcfA (HicA-like mRNA interferase family)